MQHRSGTAGIIIVILLLIGAAYLLGLNQGNNRISSLTPISVISPPTGIPSPTATATVSASPGTTTSATLHEISLTATGFSPATLSIKPGDQVVWINKSGVEGAVYSNPHPTHTDYPPLNLGTFANGGTLSLTFPTAGTYGYHNHLNPSQTGTIIVK